MTHILDKAKLWRQKKKTTGGQGLSGGREG